MIGGKSKVNSHSSEGDCMGGNNGRESRRKRRVDGQERTTRAVHGVTNCAGIRHRKKRAPDEERKCPNIKYARTMQRIRSSIIIYLGS